MTVTELLGIAVGFMLLGAGAASIVAWLLHRQHRSHALLLFGVWCSLYGARLVAEQPVILGAIGGSDRTWQYFRAFITYTITVPIGLFVEALIGTGWKGSVRRTWQLVAIFAVAAIATDLALGRPRAAMPMNSPMVLSALVVAMANIWLVRDRLSATFKTPILAIGGLAILFFVINENLGRPIAPVVNLEPIGVFTFVLALGYAVAASVFRQEAELVAVQRELETARQIQTSLLPKGVPSLAGVELAVRYVPMTAVAGDLYDFVMLGRSRVGILVADVSGHGVPAALVASMVKLAFGTQTAHADDPARVMEAMNRMLCHHVESTFVTAIYAVVDSQAHTIALANAGHPSLMVGRADRTVTESTERGLMLGLSPDASYVNERIEIRSGEPILLYTDGIPETRNRAGEFLDADRITGWLATANGQGAATVADTILGKLRQWRGGETFEDDVTFVVARVHALTTLGVDGIPES
jgi:sigma-B regulation protein RsbU (phosphoserine phosphatase)